VIKAEVNSKEPEKPKDSLDAEEAT